MKSYIFILFVLYILLSCTKENQEIDGKNKKISKSKIFDRRPQSIEIIKNIFLHELIRRELRLESNTLVYDGYNQDYSIVKDLVFEKDTILKIKKEREWYLIRFSLIEIIFNDRISQNFIEFPMQIPMIISDSVVLRVLNDKKSIDSTMKIIYGSINDSNDAKSLANLYTFYLKTSNRNYSTSRLNHVFIDNKEPYKVKFIKWYYNGNNEFEDKEEKQEYILTIYKDCTTKLTKSKHYNLKRVLRFEDLDLSIFEFLPFSDY